jgi:hypothetical protein
MRKMRALRLPSMEIVRKIEDSRFKIHGWEEVNKKSCTV